MKTEIKKLINDCKSEIAKEQLTKSLKENISH